MSYSIHHYYSGLIQIPVRPSAEFSYYGCKKHRELTFNPGDSKFCPQCGQSLKKHNVNTDVDFIQEMIDSNEGIEDVVSFAVGKGFINICLYDYESEQIDFNEGFYTDSDGYRVSIPIDFERITTLIENLKSEHANFLTSLSSHFGEIKIVPAITKTAG